MQQGGPIYLWKLQSDLLANYIARRANIPLEASVRSSSKLAI